MRFRIIHFILLIIVIAIIWGIKLFFFSGLGETLFTIGGDRFCSSDSDCVPAQCCHATSVVNRENAPNCDDVFCTFQCEAETLDCGQGQIKCINNKCEAIIDE